MEELCFELIITMYDFCDNPKRSSRHVRLSTALRFKILMTKKCPCLYRKFVFFIL